MSLSLSRLRAHATDLALLCLLTKSIDAFSVSPLVSQTLPSMRSATMTPTRFSTALSALPFDASFIDATLPLSSSTSLLSHHFTPEPLTGIPIIDITLASTTFWAIAVMLSIIALLVTWEESVHTLRQKIPPALSPVIDSMLGEIGGLGFIGLFLEIFVTSNKDRGLGDIVSNISERFLGEEEILLEYFEHLHSVFFQVGVAFFVATGVIVGSVLKRINELSDISELALDTDGDGEVSLDELADALNVKAVIVDADGDGVLTDEEITSALRRTEPRGFFQELSLTVEQRASEILLIRENFFTQHNLDQNFIVEKYFEQIFAKNLEEMVELSPLTWLPLIPLISLLDSVDLSREVVNAASENASLSAGCFITSPWFFYPSLFAQLLGLGWGVTNFWKMKKIKNMLIPTLVRDGQGGEATLLPPRYMEDELRLEVNTSPGPIAIIETSIGGKDNPPKNNHEYLFGAAGGKGPEIYRNSIKFHTWLCVSQIVFLFGQIVVRDFYTMLEYNEGQLSADMIGNIDWLVPELGVYSVFVTLAAAQLLLSPSVFLNYCTATSIEGMTQDWAIKKAARASSEECLDFD